MPEKAVRQCSSQLSPKLPCSLAGGDAPSSPIRRGEVLPVPDKGSLAMQRERYMSPDGATGQAVAQLEFCTGVRLGGQSGNSIAGRRDLSSG